VFHLATSLCSPLMGEDFNWGKAPLDKFFPGTALRAVGSSEAIQNILSN